MSFLEVDNLTKRFAPAGGMFARGGEPVAAVAGVSLSLDRGRKLGVVGESGSGKTTLGRVVMGLLQPDEGAVRFDGADVHHANPDQRRRLRRHMQMIFQDNAGALDPRLRVGAAIAEPLRVHRLGRTAAARRDIVVQWLEKVGLDASLLRRFPHELSGGQRQRIGIARALAVEPKMLIADEPVASLDVSIQTQILELLADLVRETGVTLFFISHDLRVVRALTERVLVMYRGHAVELGPTESLIRRPLHPYTQSLIAAIPALHPADRHLLAGPAATEKNDAWLPPDAPWREAAPGHYVRGV
ncbi:MAG: ATP-binding cassette domain-containing protein [Candidatus Lernaella stagnicola]|nr:ATP-binding cassette domain-containing protein [Candidatus Lernaella stagnicola]